MDDLISRQAVIKAIKDLPDCPNGFSDTYDKACIIGVLKDLPSVRPKQKKGRWIWGYEVRCSNCNYKLETTGLLSRCPNCGANMMWE